MYYQRNRSSCRSAWLLLAAASCVRGFYLPGVAPREYKDRDVVDVKVNKLTAQRSPLPYDYYSLPFCKPKVGIMHVAENIGEVLAGSVIQNSAFDVTMLNADFKVLCVYPTTKEEMNMLVLRIKQAYRIHMIIDNLPAATKLVGTKSDGEKIFLYERGFPIGFQGGGNFAGAQGALYLYNHLRFVLKYHKDPSFQGCRIVGFEMEPLSVAYKTESPTAVPVTVEPLEVKRGHKQSIVYTYDVRWEESEIKWASRWDMYLYMGQDDIHWFSILNSVVMLVLLSFIVATILVRTLRRDLNYYESPQDKEAIQEESGWKLLHGDVFRGPVTPSSKFLLAASVGTGVQVLGMTVVCLVFAVLGFLSPANRGSLMSAALFLFAFMGLLSGYSSTRLYRLMGGEEVNKNMWITALLYPGAIFILFFTMDMIIWSQGSSGAVPFLTMLALLGMWFGVSLPLNKLGAFYASKAEDIKAPVKTLGVARVIPFQQWYNHWLFTVPLGGALPFGALFLELNFIFSSVWMSRFYYMFGFLALAILILLLTSAEACIVLLYFQLTAEDHQWWWRSFFTAGSTAIYALAYSCYHFFTEIGAVTVESAVVYALYICLFSLLFFAMCGAIGFLSCLGFTWKIYAACKAD